MADFEPLTIPAVMPAEVPLAKPDGKPSKHWISWMEGLQAWMKANVANTNTRLNLVSEEVDGAYAAIETEATTRASEDEALAEQITTVSASVDDATANGEIYFAAKAAPSGATAAYGLYLTAGSSFAGLEAIAQSGGGSAIGLTANQFSFTDAGTQFVPFTYSGGVFYFNTAVVFQATGASGTTITSGGLTLVYDASSNLRLRMGVWED